MSFETLTPDECRTLIRQMQDDREQTDDVLLHEHADEFEDAWLDLPWGSLKSMQLCLSSTLPYRLHLIPKLVALRLNGIPPT